MSKQLYHEVDGLLPRPIELTQPVAKPERKASFWGGSSSETEETNKNVVIESARKVMQSAVTEMINSNAQVFNRVVVLENNITIRNVSCLGDFNYVGNSQSMDIIENTNIDFTNTATVSIKTAMTTRISDAFTDTDTTNGSMLSDTTGQFAGALTNAFGGDTNKKTTLNSDIKKACQDAVNATVENKLTNSNIQSAATASQNANKITIENIRCGGNANISGNDQVIMLDSFIEALMENTFDLDVVTTMVTDIESRVTTAIESNGDIAAAGAAAAGVVGAAGAALAENITAAGGAVATAVTPFTDVANNAVDEAGDTAQTAIYAMILPLIVFIIVAGIVMSQMGSSQNA
jgi:hypothetical protein